MDDLIKYEEVKKRIMNQYTYEEFIEKVFEEFEDKFEDLTDVELTFKI